MGKADFLSPKAIANRIKSKGLQKLRWYCQMCQKQCRDEVGCSFKPCYFRLFVVVYVLALFCLLGSSTERFQVSLHVRVPPEAAAAGLRKPQQVHGRFLRVSSLSCEGGAETWRCCSSHWQVLVSSLPVSSEVSSWSCSEDDLVSRDPPTPRDPAVGPALKIENKTFVLSAGTKRVHNNIVYNEYISDREHVHMNSTQWETLTDFTKWLGREGTAHTPACTPVVTFRMVEKSSRNKKGRNKQLRGAESSQILKLKYKTTSGLVVFAF